MKSFEKTGPSPVPKLLLWVSIAVLGVSGLMLIVGGLHIGVTWDEPYHVERFDNYLEHGWYVIDAQSVDGKPFASTSDQYVYGPATMAFLHLWNLVFGADPSGSVSTSAHAYALRHLGISFLAMLCLLGVGTLGRLVLRRWDWGVVAAALLCATPLWTGHSMFNLKDVPVATGYVWITVGLCLVARRAPGGLGRRVAAAGCLAAGAFLAIGTRPGMWTAAFASTTVLSILVMLRERGDSTPLFRRHRWQLGELLAGYGIGYLGLIALYPKVFGSPLLMAYESATSSASFLDIKASRAFVPAHVLLQTPLLVLMLIGIGVVAALAAIVRGRGRSSDAQIRLALVGVQLFALPAITMVHRSALYSDLRQLLFAAPAAAVFAAVGLATLVERSRRRVDPVPMALLTAFGALALVLPAADQATLFPYNYAYYNPVGQAADARINLDYYRASARELVDSLPPEGRVVCSPPRLADPNVALRVSHLDGARDCRTSVISPISAYAADAHGSEPALTPEEFWVVQSARWALPENCSEIARVTRRRLGQRETLSRLARCRLDPPLLGKAGIVLGELPDPSWSLIDEGWYLPAFSPHGKGFRAFPSGGTIRFRLPASAGPQVLVVRTAEPMDPGGIRVEYDGANVPVTARGSKELLVTLPADPAGEHELEFRPAGGKLFVLSSVVLER